MITHMHWIGDLEHVKVSVSDVHPIDFIKSICPANYRGEIQ